LAALAAVLIMIGFNLAKPSMFMSQLRMGAGQWAPFLATIIGVLGLDLLKGVVIGIIVAIAMNVRGKVGKVIEKQQDGQHTSLRFLHDATFLSKLEIGAALQGIAPNSTVTIDANGHRLDYDVKDQLADFVRDGAHAHITASVRGVELSGGSSH
jgi:MFS superfamily sulfate permease-like transporter